MKVGIMTMQRVPNYGSFMQALSLKRIIESLGHEVIFVDYKVNPDVEHRNNIGAKLKCSVKMINKLIRGTRVGNLIYQVVKSHSSQKMIVDKQNIFFSCNDMLGVSNKYKLRTKVDVLIIGSDEVFNCLQPGFNVGYSLELFGKNNRARRVISYAASFGNTTLQRLRKYGVTEEIGGLIDQMSAVSVRDDNSLHIVEEISHKKAEVHLDPVLVGNLELESWKIPNVKGYVILYGYKNRFTDNECEKIMEFAHSKDRKLISIGEPQVNCDQYICCKPDEVIGYFKKADYVITDTFHGTIFSVITHRKFLTIARTSVNGVGGNEEKIGSLLDHVGLRSRLVTDFDSIGDKIDREIDYGSVDSIRREARISTLNYLKKNICI